MGVNINANAKINLLLDIEGEKDDGYHLLKMVMQSISLKDSIYVDFDESAANNGIEIICTDENLPLDENNIACKAAKAYFDYTKIENKGIYIKIIKRIPIAAGLAGGSADAAGVILALDRLHETDLQYDQLKEIGFKVGADVPFCLCGGTMTAEGAGEILAPLPDLPECHIVLAKPFGTVSTAYAYKQYDKANVVNRPDYEGMINAICGRNIFEIGSLLGNVFEEVLNLESVNNIKKIMDEYSPVGRCMSGSGPSVFAVFDNKNTAEECLSALKQNVESVFLCSPKKYGCKFD